MIKTSQQHSVSEKNIGSHPSSQTSIARSGIQQFNKKRILKGFFQVSGSQIKSGTTSAGDNLIYLEQAPNKQEHKGQFYD